MSQTAGPAINAENSFGYSGIGKALVLAPYADQKFTAVAQSGAQTVVGSGAGMITGVVGLVGLLSGGGVAASQSGCTITVYEGVSGTILTPQSGATTYGSNTGGIFYQFSFGTTSGLVTGVSGGISLPIAPPDVLGINSVFRSGLMACVSGGTVGTVGIEVLYTRAF